MLERDKNIIRLAIGLKITPQGCWIFRGYKTSKGYGSIGFKNKVLFAHRFSYELFVGKIPEGLVIDHLCRNRACVNPEHLEPITNKKNVLKGIGITASNKRKTECLRGHPFNKENTYVTPDGKRNCKFCKGKMQKIYNKTHYLKYRKIFGKNYRKVKNAGK